VEIKGKYKIIDFGNILPIQTKEKVNYECFYVTWAL